MIKQLRLVQLMFFFTVLFLSGPFAWDFHITFEKKVLDLKTQMDGGILVDDDGFLWIGTAIGLYRYDGYELKKYDLDSNGGTWFVAIVKDQNEVLWFGTHNGGVSSFNKTNNTWSHYKHNPNDKNSLSSNVIPYSNQSLYIDKANKLWVATENEGLNQFDEATNTWTHYRHDPGNKNSLSSDKITDITEDKNGILWIGTMDAGMNSFDRKNKTWTHYSYNPDDINNSLSDNYVQAIIEDRDGILWIGTNNGGLNKFNRKSKTFSHYKHNPKNPNSIGDNNVFYIFEDSHNRLWLCKYHSRPNNAGISILNKKTETFYRYYADPKNPYAPSTNFISGVYEDTKTGIFWFTNTYGSQTLMVHKLINMIKKRKNLNAGIMSQNIRLFLEKKA